MDSRQQFIHYAKQTLSRLKPYLRWLILGGTLFFLSSSLRQHWTDVTALRIAPVGWAMLTVALGVTLIAHIWTGWVWSWILRELNQPASGVWGVLIYLKTNIAKYLPGNVWHLYGRVVAAQEAGFLTGAATLSVVLEPLLMAAAALTIALISLRSAYGWLQLLSLAGVLIFIHPRFLNPLLQWASRVKGQKAEGRGQKAEGRGQKAEGRRQRAEGRRQKAEGKNTEPQSHEDTKHSPSTHPPIHPSTHPPIHPSTHPPIHPSTQLKRYPLLPLLGEFIFVLLRGVGFLLTVWVLAPVSLAQVPAILSAFSLSWLLGLVIPGAPGGIGVFEATAIALLNAQLPAAVILGSVALYRLISTLAEAGGAGLAWLDDR